MKKISKNIIAKVSMLCLLVITQMQLWAQSAASSETGSTASQALSKPAFWIGVVLFIACVIGFFKVGRNKKEPQYQ